MRTTIKDHSVWRGAGACAPRKLYNSNQSKMKNKQKKIQDYVTENSEICAPVLLLLWFACLPFIFSWFLIMVCFVCLFVSQKSHRILISQREKLDPQGKESGVSRMDNALQPMLSMQQG